MTRTFVVRSPELATAIGLPAVSTSETGRAPPDPPANVTLACVVESCRHATGAVLESALTKKARRATSRRSGDGRVSAKLAGNPLGICVEPVDESALRR